MNVVYIFGFVFLQEVLRTRCTDPYAPISGPVSKKKGVSRTSIPYANEFANGYYPSQQRFYTSPSYSGYPYAYNQIPYSSQQLYSPPQMAMPYGYASTQPYYFPNTNYLNPSQAHLPAAAITPTNYAGIPQQIPYPWGFTYPTYPRASMYGNVSSYAVPISNQLSLPWRTGFPAYPPALMNKNYPPALNNSSSQTNNSTGNETNLSAIQSVQSYYPNDVASSLESEQSLISPIITSNGETGTDMNSLPPQVKEFIDMIPEILSMPENSSPAVSPQPPALPSHRPLPHPIRKHQKPLPLYKKKSYYPQGYYE